MDALISSSLTKNKGRGDAKSLVLFLNSYHHWKCLVQLVWNVHIEKIRIYDFMFV